MRVFYAVAIVLVCSVAVADNDVLSCSFNKGGWNPSEWVLVKSPRWEHFGEWVQAEDHIRNTVPSGCSDKGLQSKRAAETYTSMVCKRKLAGNTITVRVTMAFTYRMAPLIVLAPELGKDAKGRPEYREHFEIVLFDKGVNVWHHFYRDGKPSWKQAALARFTLKPNTPYELVVRKGGNRHGKFLEVSVAGHTFAYWDDSLPDACYVGITGCEGVNRFYKFSVSEK